MAERGGALRARGLRRAFHTPDGTLIPVLDIATLEVANGAAVGFTGPSGAGKTTLLYALTGIERLDAGSVYWGGEEVSALRESARDRWRRLHVGFVFQDINLLPGLSVLDNVLVPARFDRWRVPQATRQRAGELLGLAEAPDPRAPVDALSRGEQQRVAIARALLGNPDIVVADEPTASLDARNGLRVTELLLGACREAGATLLVVSHDAALNERLDRVFRLVNGALTAAEEG